MYASWDMAKQNFLSINITLLHICTINKDMMYRSLDIRHDGQFALYPTDNLENQNFDNNEKNV